MHERSGEIELLISGALVFGLFQVPGYLNELVGGMTPRLSEAQFLVVFMLAFYVRMIVMTLIASFLLHLVTRAYWVGLIGLDSVFPDGVHWDRINYGPLAKSVYVERLPRLSALAARADDFGSSIFSFAFWISILFVWSIVFGGLLAGVWYALRSALLPGFSVNVFLGFVVGIAMIPGVAITIDKAFSARLDPEGGVARALKATIAGAYWVTGGALFMPIQFTLFSRVPKKFIWPLFIGVFAVLMVGYLGAETWRSGSLRMSASQIYPERPGPRTLLSAHYAQTRDPEATVPYLQAPVIEGAYAELTIPLVAARLGERFDTVCPDFEGTGSSGILAGYDAAMPADVAYERRLLDCLARVWTLSLDGTPLAVEWDLRWETGYGPTSIVAFLDMRGVRPGAHVLEVREVARPRTERELDELDATGEAAPGPAIDYVRFRR